MGQSEKTFLNTGDAARDFSDTEIDALFSQVLAQVRAELGNISSVLLLPPDITRFHSRAGFLTGIACRELIAAGIAVTVLPALGTHIPLSGGERERMFPGVPASLFRVHDWRNDVAELGRI